MIGIDFETFALSRENPSYDRGAPKPVCLSLYKDREQKSGLIGHEKIEQKLDYLLRRATLVAHNFAFEAKVIVRHYPNLIKPFFRALDEGRLICSEINAKLWAMSDGSFDGKAFSLAACVERELKIVLDKDADLRTGFGELYDLPLKNWPQRAVDYAKADAEYCVKLVQKMGVHKAARHQTCYEIAHALVSLHGIRIDREWEQRLYDRKFKPKLEAAKAELEELDAFVKDVEGMLKLTEGRPHVKQKMLRERMFALTGNKSIDRESLADLSLLQAERAWGVAARDDIKLLNTYSRYNELNRYRPFDCDEVHPTYFLKRTGRRYASSPNTQNLPNFPGVRAAIIPRDGYIFSDIDYAAQELRVFAAMAENELKCRSAMAEALRERKDLHTVLACNLLNINLADYDPSNKEHTMARKLAKEANFGLLGGMGVKRFLETARKRGFDFDEDQARSVIETFERTWPEFKVLKDRVNKTIKKSADLSLRALGGRAVRPSLDKSAYCQIANAFFQAPAADCTAEALYRLVREAYTDETSPLFGSRPVIVAHDQIVLEVAVDKAEAAFERHKHIMIESMTDVLETTIPVVAEGGIAYRWDKQIAEVRNNNNKLIPWEPKGGWEVYMEAENDKL